MDNLTRIDDSEYVATDPVTGGMWRVVGPRLTREGAVQAIERQIADTGARPAGGTRTTLQVGVRMAEERPAPDAQG